MTKQIHSGRGRTSAKSGSNASDALEILPAIDASAEKLRATLKSVSVDAVPPALRRSIHNLLKSIAAADLSEATGRTVSAGDATTERSAEHARRIARLVEENLELEQELQANAARHRSQLTLQGATTRAELDLKAELGSERERRKALEVLRIEHLNRIAQLVNERTDLENELQANAARHRKQLASAPSKESRPEPSQPLATPAASPIAAEEDLPQFTRQGRLDPAKARSMQIAAREAFKAARWSDAVLLYRAYLSYHPRRAAPWKQFAHALKENGQTALAERAYFRSLAIDPSDVDTALHLGHLLKNRGKTDLAVEVFMGGLKVRPDHVELRHSLGDLGRPLPELTTRPSTPPTPTGFQAWLLRQKIVQAQKSVKARRWREAAERYRKLADQRQDGRLVVQYGHALKESGDLAGAEQAYRRALDLIPLSSDAWLQLGHALKLKGDLAGALNAYNTAVRLGPDNADALREI
ncbi:tetratricopeptide repeat protein [Brevundimonas naejangsanensis]|uniref:tetratricopeptide repeat protein n=1 Tax=Brevundimonas naejangsanensis TaxID=588932 RepID=UPI0026EF47F0|nr:tetratricopeptide repeat protein [Brevundimonas naejangsanensis]